MNEINLQRRTPEEAMMNLTMKVVAAEKRVTELEAEVAALRRDRERLRSIHENGLCDNWLEECEERHCEWDRFLELVDEQVEMDADERTPEFQEQLRQALKDAAGIGQEQKP